MNPKKQYRLRRKEECLKLLENFQPDLKGCRNPKEVLQILELLKQGFYSREIALIINKTPKAVQKIFRRYNFPSLYNFCPPRLEERKNFSGGLKIDKTGHIYKRCPNHPNGSKHGSYVALHRLILEEHLGRYLTQKEVVHHLDGNPQNNDIENLKLYKNNAEHLADTLKGKCPKWSLVGLSVLNRPKKRAKNGRFVGLLD